ncbi:MAG: helix-turn-helix domain-containing protein [Eubacterium sp.]|nr:helix-turn-helix domain-containing protein [Eubacterium sp.]
MGNLQIEIGKKITEQRKKANMNQSDLAFELDKSLRTIQKYESGDIDISISTLQTIAEILNVPINYFLGYDSSHIKIESLADVYAFIFELDKKKEIDFKIEVEKATDIHNWKCSIIINGNDQNHEINYPLVQTLKEFQKNRDSVNVYWMGYQQYDEWEEKMINRHSNCFLTDKEREYLDNQTRMRRFIELNKNRMEEMIAQQDDGDDEQ